jgi:NitT/TauT family transport system substrate-binding protein
MSRARTLPTRRGASLGIALLALLLALPAPLPRPASADAAAREPVGGSALVVSPSSATPAEMADPPAQALTTVRVGMQYIVSDAGVLIADEWGYLREVGLQLQGERLDNVDLQTALASGQVDAGGIGPTAAVLNAFMRGVRLRIVADRGTLAPGFGYLALVVRKDLVDSGQVRSIADLRGRKIGAQPPLHATPGWYLLSRILERGGISENDIEYVPLGFADQNAGLAGRTIDAAWQAEPGPTGAVENGLGVRLVGADEAIGPVTLGGLAYSESFAAQTDLARRFMLAYIRGARTYLDAFSKNQGREAVVGLLARNTSLRDPALYDRMVMPWISPDGEFSTFGYDEVQNYFVRHGVLPRAIDINQIVDNSFAQWAARQLGPYQ